MKRIFSLGNLSSQLSQVNSCFSNSLPNRGLRFQVKIKWVAPERPPLHDPKRSGDLNSSPPIDEKSIKKDFQDSEELKTASEEVKRIFSMKYQPSKEILKLYKKQLVDQVKRNEFDECSLEVQIAKLTAKLHYLRPIIEAESKNSTARIVVNNTIGKRTKLLRILRGRDYRRFEWLLEKLNITYKPLPAVGPVPTRKNSLTLLSKLKVETEKEKKIGELKKLFDEQKIPFLTKKLEKLKWIQKMEKENNFTETVTEEDIEKCKQQIEAVKADIEERKRKGYERKIHPFFLEPYDEDLLREKEKASTMSRMELESKEDKKESNMSTVA